jgi:hypothetical protein
LPAVKYALFRSQHCYTITLAERDGDPKFELQHPQAEKLEEGEFDTWEEAVEHFNRRTHDYWVFHDPMNPGYTGLEDDPDEDGEEEE